MNEDTKEILLDQICNISEYNTGNAKFKTIRLTKNSNSNFTKVANFHILKSFQMRPATSSEHASFLVPLKCIEEKKNDLDIITSDGKSQNYSNKIFSKFTNKFQKFKKQSESERKERVHFRNNKCFDNFKVIGQIKRQGSKCRIRSPEKSIASQRNRSHSSMAEYMYNSRETSVDYLDVPKRNNIIFKINNLAKSSEKSKANKSFIKKKQISSFKRISSELKSMHQSLYEFKDEIEECRKTTSKNCVNMMNYLVKAKELNNSLVKKKRLFNKFIIEDY